MVEFKISKSFLIFIQKHLRAEEGTVNEAYTTLTPGASVSCMSISTYLCDAILCNVHDLVIYRQNIDKMR